MAESGGGRGACPGTTGSLRFLDGEGLVAGVEDDGGILARVSGALAEGAGGGGQSVDDGFRAGFDFLDLLDGLGEEVAEDIGSGDSGWHERRHQLNRFRKNFPSNQTTAKA